MAVMNITQTKDMLLNLPIEISILISGNHGIGKSAIVKQVAAARGVPCIDFRLSQNDVGDLKGMPFHVKGRTVYAIPEFFPLREADAIELKDLLGLAEDISLGRYGESGILFLDEINRANREVQQAAFELVLDRRLNLRSLPDGWRVVAAINGDDSIYTVNAMEPAFLSRFCLIDLKPTIQEWLRWAEDPMQGNIHSSITQFILKKSEFLDPTPELLKEASRQGIIKVHDRRAWEMFSKTIKKFSMDHEKGNRKIAPLAKNEDSYSELILVGGSFVGHLASLSFKTFIELDYDALDANVILNRFSPEIRNKLISIVGRIPELAAYNEMIVTYISKNIKSKLSLIQKRNLTDYVSILPKELVGNFWQHFNEVEKDISDDWYNHDDKTTKFTSDLIMNALVNPNAKKKIAAAKV